MAAVGLARDREDPGMTNEASTRTPNRERDGALAMLESLTFVEWDRAGFDDMYIVVYGWIARSDGGRDFVLVTIDRSSGVGLEFTTSSAKYTQELNNAFGMVLETHTPCVPWRVAIEHVGIDLRRCRACGCTDDAACDGGCSWAEADLCSRCVEVRA